jgi:hypothetical protein
LRQRGKQPKGERPFLDLIYFFRYPYHSILAMGMEDMKEMQLTTNKNLTLMKLQLAILVTFLPIVLGVSGKMLHLKHFLSFIIGFLEHPTYNILKIL